MLENFTRLPLLILLLLFLFATVLEFNATDQKNRLCPTLNTTLNYVTLYTYTNEITLRTAVQHFIRQAFLSPTTRLSQRKFCARQQRLRLT